MRSRASNLIMFQWSDDDDVVGDSEIGTFLPTACPPDISPFYDCLNVKTLVNDANLGLGCGLGLGTGLASSFTFT